MCCANVGKAQDDERPPQLAPPPTAAPAAHSRTHDGLLLRGSLGLGVGLAREKQVDRPTYAPEGLGASLSLDIGAAAIDNLIIYGRLRAYSTDGLAGHTTSELGVFGVSAGVSYYLPANFCIGAAIGPSWGFVNQHRKAGIGVGFDLEFGREWWMGKHWGVGPGLRFSYATMSGKGTAPDSYQQLTGMLIAVLVSATYS